jgi:hypothetical protein
MALAIDGQTQSSQLGIEIHQNRIAIHRANPSNIHMTRDLRDKRLGLLRLQTQAIDHLAECLAPAKGELDRQLGIRQLMVRSGGPHGRRDEIMVEPQRPNKRIG